MGLGIKATEAEVHKQFGQRRSCQSKFSLFTAEGCCLALSGSGCEGRELSAIARELGAVFLVGIGGKLGVVTAMMYARRIMMTGAASQAGLRRSEQRYHGVWEPGAGRCV